MGIQFINIPPHSDEWYSFRNSNGLGASDLGTIMSLNQYMSSLELFHFKIGRAKRKPMNLRMHIGLISEKVITELVEYWDKDEQKYLANLAGGKKVRELEEVNAYCVNSDYPNLFASLDRRFKDEKGDYVSVELKNKTSLSYKQFTSEMNPMELMQVCCQLLLTGYNRGMLFYFIDNTRIDVLEVTQDDALRMKPVIQKTVKEFWGKVVRAREVINQIENAKQNYNMKLVAELEMELLSYEPIGEGEAYLEYMTERARDKKNMIALKGNNEQLAIAKDLNKLVAKRKKIESKEIELKSKLVQQLHQADKTELDFGKEGRFIITNGRITNKVK